jgi:hypothetical protein
MTRAYLILPIAFVWACGPSSKPTHAKTPDELLEDQEQLADQEAQERKDHPPDVEPEGEQKMPFDKKQADLEVKRAQRSAETCPSAVTEQGPGGSAHVTLTFASDGHVKDATIGAPFDDTPVGKCALNAMKAVIVPPYDGSDETVEVDLNLTPKEDATKADDKKGGKKKK